jgi:hypothetical protein
MLIAKSFHLLLLIQTMALPINLLIILTLIMLEPIKLLKTPLITMLLNSNVLMSAWKLHIRMTYLKHAYLATKVVLPAVHHTKALLALRACPIENMIKPHIHAVFLQKEAYALNLIL